MVHHYVERTIKWCTMFDEFSAQERGTREVLAAVENELEPLERSVAQRRADLPAQEARLAAQLGCAVLQGIERVQQ